MVSDRQRNWKTVSSSVIGSQHRRVGLPNQDAVATLAFPSGGAILAVADGHGDEAHTRSDVGARIATDIGVEFGQQLLAVLPSALDDHDLMKSLARHYLAVGLVGEWNRRVDDHHQKHPLLADAPHSGRHRDAYGSTVLVAVALEDVVIAAQLGDGDVFIVGMRGGVVTPFPRDDRYVAGATTSLCLQDSEQEMRIVVLRCTDACVILIASDGYGNSFAEDDWHLLVGADLTSRLKERGLDAVEKRLPEWLADSAEITGDDVTVALAYRGPAGTSSIVQRDRKGSQ